VEGSRLLHEDAALYAGASKADDKSNASRPATVDGWTAAFKEKRAALDLPCGR